MPQLLTKEQRDWLIEKIKKYTEPVNGVADVWFVNANNLENIINQCTEQEFPDFKLEYDEAWLAIYEAQTVEFKIVVANHAAWIVLDKTEFLEYAKKVAKIKEWLEQNIK